jgi:hypothetical protein
MNKRAKSTLKAGAFGAGTGVAIGGAISKPYSETKLTRQRTQNPEDPSQSITVDSLHTTATGAGPMDTLHDMAEWGGKLGLAAMAVKGAIDVADYARTASRASKGRKAHMLDSANKARR